MVATRHLTSRQVRARLGHQVIDVDGHYIELVPLIEDYVKQIGGGKAVDAFNRYTVGRAGMRRGRTGIDERADRWTPNTGWWAFPAANTLDRATVSMPKLLHHRMDELGIDFSVLYPTTCLAFNHLPGDANAEMRQVLCRAFNTYLADTYREFSDRMTPAAAIPMHTPQEAIAELEHAVKVLGLKTVLIEGQVFRPIPSVHRENPGMDSLANRMDHFGIDSPYDYDPVWKKCLELGVSPTNHSSGMGWGSRRSISRFAYNHIGHFAACAEALCKSLFMGGVTRRLPAFKIAFLECGVGWGCILYADLIGHWEKRNAKALEILDPSKLDMRLMDRLLSQYGGAPAAAKREAILEHVARDQWRPEVLDDYAQCGIRNAEDIKDLFAPHFYFGCEADDPLVPWAFNTQVNPFGARLNAMFSSDMGHWDVPDIKEVVQEAYELVEDRKLTEADFKDFMFSNAVRLYGSNNPNFFKGTACETEAAKVLNTPLPLREGAGG